VLSSRMISLERLLGDKIYYYDDVESFVKITIQILGADRDEGALRALAEEYDWKAIAKRYGIVLNSARDERH